MNRDEARALLRGCRDYGDAYYYLPMLRCMKSVFETASDADRTALNEVIRDWLIGDDSDARFDAVWLVDELRLTENLDLIRRLRDEAELRDDWAAPYDWERFSQIVGRLSGAAD